LKCPRTTFLVQKDLICHRYKKKMANSQVAKDYRDKDGDISRVFHLTFLFLFNLIRVSVLPHFLKRRAIALQIPIYLLYDYLLYSWKLDPGLVKLDLNIFHDDHLARFVQLLVWIIGLVVFLNIPGTIVVFSILCLATLSWKPDWFWVSTFVEMIIQTNNQF